MSKRPLILITNDDGITSAGICALAEAVADLGEVHVVAPDSPQSGMGHAVTIGEILRIKPAYFPIKGINAHSTSGTPVDCVKLAIYKILNRKPDLLLSGINHGSNSSINVIYSGTMSAAVEGAVENIPAIGFSLLDHAADADFTAAKKIARQMAKEVLKRGLPSGTCLNVNIPKLPLKDLKGIKVCRQAAGFWEDAFEERTAPNHETYYWLTGEFINLDKEKDSDQWALNNGYISIVPIMYDMTSYSEIDDIAKWNLNG